MANALMTERLAAMTQPEQTISERFAALNRQREEHGISINRLSKAAGYPSKSNQTWYNLRDGKSPDSTMRAFEAALERILEDAEDAFAEPESDRIVATRPNDLIELEVTGDFGVRVVVRAPVGNADELERFAARIIRDIRAGQDLDRGSD